MVEYADLHQSRMVESLFVPDDLDGDVLVGHVIERSDDLSEATLPDNFQNFVSVADVIVQNLNKLLRIYWGNTVTHITENDY